MRGRGYISALVAASIFWTSAISQSYDDKIIGGSVVHDIRQTPHVTSIQLLSPQNKTWQPFCGGSIFSPLYVITACHCVTQVDPKSGLMLTLADYIPMEFWRFVAGTVHLAKLSDSTQVRTPQDIRHHPRCDRTSPGNDTWLVFDLALAKMAEPFTFNDYVKPLKIFSLNREEFETHLDELMLKRQQRPKCMVAGWGSTKQQSLIDFFIDAIYSTTESTKLPSNANSEQPEDDRQLKMVIMYPMYEGECLIKLVTGLTSVFGKVNLQTVQHYGDLLHRQICALGIDGSGAVCKGDSGSGLLCNGSIVGVTSWGLGCGTQVPDVFQGIPVVIGWFAAQVCSVQSCTDVIHFPQQCIRTELDERTVRSYVEKCVGSERVQNGTTDEPRATESRRTTEGVQISSVKQKMASSVELVLPALALHLLTILCIHFPLKLFPL